MKENNRSQIQELKDKQREEMAKVQEQYEAEVSLLKDSLSQHSTVEEKEDRMKTEIDKLKSSLEKYRHQEQAAERKEIELSERIVALESQIQKSKEQSNKYNEYLSKWENKCTRLSTELTAEKKTRIAN